MDFEWDPAKAASNVGKHGISFEEASSAFGDPLAHSIQDPLHSHDEERFVLMGQTNVGRLAVVVYTDRDETVRIVSARLATPSERRRYEQTYAARR
jgi:uncharacterized DUF497 family protein